MLFGVLEGQLLFLEMKDLSFKKGIYTGPISSHFLMNRDSQQQSSTTQVNYLVFTWIFK